MEPAVRKAAEQGLSVEGSFPSDTVFLRAKNGDFNAVLTMYHDQGQIAIRRFPLPDLHAGARHRLRHCPLRHRQHRRQP
jgi:Pyridoxal phosphate biosynthetic protein PdxA